MDLVDLSLIEHARAVAKILAFTECPQRCLPTGRVKQDLIRLRLSKGALLDAIAGHLRAGLPLYSQIQTMYERQDQLAYVFCPIALCGGLYCKVMVVVDEDGVELLRILAAHEPTFPCPGGKK